jgi:hypothetical protein
MCGADTDATHDAAQVHDGCSRKKVCGHPSFCNHGSRVRGGWIRAGILESGCGSSIAGARKRDVEWADHDAGDGLGAATHSGAVHR